MHAPDSSVRKSTVFTVPAYYKDFLCKGGRCRHTCCDGLAIAITQDEYFRLVGLACTERLRRQLDVSLIRIPYGDPGRFALLSPDFTGRCRMLDEDGLCRLHAECGGDMLAGVCRYFPRRPRRQGSGAEPEAEHRSESGPECACANACEHTLELLWDNPDAMRLVTQELSFDLPRAPASGEIPPALCRRMTVVMADSSRPFADRLQELGCPGPDYSDAHLQRIRRIIAWAEESCASVSVFCRRALTLPDICFARHFEQLAKLRYRFPDFDGFLSRALANDIFFLNYPSPDEGGDISFAGRALRDEIDTLLYLTAANEELLLSKEDVIDLFAAFFRMVDLTNFQHNILAAGGPADPDGGPGFLRRGSDQSGNDGGSGGAPAAV
ncbi:hypothetical protein [Lachnoclostridium sp. Marseille-P6806]|uniref:hypothetical protein n=1 Tax=Lachnoclostridium sp. Marseille-P6806 TaxID=2364793 RepID=UPI00102F41A7|nr:hypothetical protein [Lachnoclostridium sp. Marseille-P6806]